MIGGMTGVLKDVIPFWFIIWK
jgi:hypothetical protein